MAHHSGIHLLRGLRPLPLRRQVVSQRHVERDTLSGIGHHFVERDTLAADHRRDFSKQVQCKLPHTTVRAPFGLKQREKLECELAKEHFGCRPLRQVQDHKTVIGQLQRETYGKPRLLETNTKPRRCVRVRRFVRW